MWQAFTATGADLLWRVPANRILPVDKRLRDGSGSPTSMPPPTRPRRDPVEVRVLAYQLKATADGYRLVTSLLDARRYPAGSWPASTVNAGRSNLSSPRSKPTSGARGRAQQQDP